MGAAAGPEPQAARSTGGVVLIGMPGAGKSTAGVLLAKLMGAAFVDTDILIQQRAGRRLQQLLDEAGYRELRRLEEEAILALDAGHAVIATGGSAVYSDRAMHHLGGLGRIVYLKATCGLLASRIDDYGQRGIANPAGQSLADIYRERTPLYERWADVIVEVDRLKHVEVARAVLAAIGSVGFRSDTTI